MRIDELKRIAEENDYEYEADSMKHQFKRQTRRINISKKDEKTLWITSNSYCDDKDFNMIKAAVEFAETPIEDREEEKYYLVKFSEKEIEGIKKKFDTDLKDFELMEVENDIKTN